jgi:hypothetical protein
MITMLIGMIYVCNGGIEVQADSALGSKEVDFFTKMNKRNKAEEDGYLVIDTINGVNKDSVIIEGVEIEKEVISKLIVKQKKDEKVYKLIDKYIKKFENEPEKIDKLKKLNEKIKKKGVSSDEVLTYLNGNGYFEVFDDIFIELIPEDRITYDGEFELMQTYFYKEFYVGTYVDFDEEYTYEGIYTREKEYYLVENSFDWGFSCPADTDYKTYKFELVGCREYDNYYTGATRNTLTSTIDSYAHLEVLPMTYQSYDFGTDIGIAPKSNIWLINDFEGRQKMIIDDAFRDHIGTPFKITQDQHYSRNDDYNWEDTRLNGFTPVENLYSSLQEYEDNGYVLQEMKGSYFHQLLGQTNNKKLLKEVMYYNTNCECVSRGSYEIVLDSQENPVFDSLTTFSFNFATNDTYYDEWDVEEWFVDPISDAHYIVDVYPYLFWGNTVEDYKYHSAYERFIWDKDSADIFHDDGSGYEGKDKCGLELIEVYSNTSATCGDNCIGYAMGTPIPQEVIDLDVLFGNDDFGPMFEFPSSYSISRYVTSRDWTTYMTNFSDNSNSIETIYEKYDGVQYGTPGVYYVDVTAEDKYGNETTKRVAVYVIGNC